MLISIIIPVYNSEKYLEKCLNSIINQTYKELDIILIDNGSTDSSNEICKEYQKRDERIKLITVENKGVSDARNKGLDIAEGEYISFVDSDDTIEPNFIQSLYETCKKNNADISVININYKYSNHINRPLNMETQVISNKEFYRQLTEGIKGFVANKLYKKEVISNIRFDTGITICEDLLFNVEIAKNVKKISILNEYLYNYYQNPNSAHNSNNRQSNIKKIEAYNRILKIISENSPENLIFYKYQYLKTAIEIKKEEKLKDEESSSLKKTIYKYYKEVMHSNKITFKQKLYIKVSNRCYNFLKLIKYIKNRVI